MFVDVVINSPLKNRFTYIVPPNLEIEVGQRVVIPFGKRELVGYVVELKDNFQETDFKLKEVKRVLDEIPLFGKREIELAKWIASFYLCSEGEALSNMIPSGRRPINYKLAAQKEYQPITLTNDQQGVVDNILSSEEKLHYLYGVTGSGKSEVFLKAAEKIIEQGKEVIYLVPEITLTHQLAQQVASRFENRVAIIHSHMSPSQRLKVYQQIRKEKIKLVIGPRSAVFAPFKNLGLIIIDEEHENSYKSGSKPRYHARQVAQMIVTKEKDALLLMGSATPSLESYHMVQQQKIVFHSLLDKVAGGSKADIEIVNMIKERSLLSKKLRSAIKSTLDQKKQVILFLNRRGFSHYFHCNSCGYEMSCPHCSVSLTYHKYRNKMVCHYCGKTQDPIDVCPNCNSVDVGYGGFGTEMVEQEVNLHFPNAVVERLDTDAAQDRKSIGTLLERFKNGEIDILLGTQMVAKGLNFPFVDLVGIVLADSGLNLPDFRAQERTFGLIVQVSGRTGRYNDFGKVVVQTFHPDNSAIKLATRQMVDEFYKEELENRKITNFPPYSRLINFVIRGKNKEKSRLAIESLEKEINKVIGKVKGKVDLMGAVSCPIEKIAGSWRYHILLRGEDIRDLLQIATHIDNNFKVASSLFLEIDVDPLNLL